MDLLFYLDTLVSLSIYKKIIREILHHHHLMKNGLYYLELLLYQEGLFYIGQHIYNNELLETDNEVRKYKYNLHSNSYHTYHTKILVRLNHNKYNSNKSYKDIYSLTLFVLTGAKS